MIKGELAKPKVCKEDIFRLISSYDVYVRFFGKFMPNIATCNHLRGEETASFIIGSKSGEWRHFDFGNDYWRGDCIDLVQQIYKIDYLDALRLIDKEFKLGLYTGEINKSKEIITWEKSKEILIPPPFIQVITKKYTKEMLKWWNMYHQDIDDLKREDIFCPHKIFRNRRLLPMKESLLTMAYYEATTDSWKLYRPDGRLGKNVPTNERKWDSNIKFDVVEGLNNIKDCKIAIVGKARKCMMVIKKALSMNCGAVVQAEDPHCMNETTLKYIKDNSEIQIIASDNDDKGRKFSYWLTKEHQYKHCNVPYNVPILGTNKTCKDFSEWGKDYGLEVIFNHFKNKQLI